MSDTIDPIAIWERLAAVDKRAVAKAWSVEYEPQFYADDDPETGRNPRYIDDGHNQFCPLGLCGDGIAAVRDSCMEDGVPDEHVIEDWFAGFGYDGLYAAPDDDEPDTIFHEAAAFINPFDNGEIDQAAFKGRIVALLGGQAEFDRLIAGDV